METGGMFVGVALFLLFVFVVIGGPAMLVDWMRARRHEVTRRQIALTDALDGHFGTIVSPVVRRPMWGPWEIEIAVPFSRSGAVGRILGVVHEVLSGVDGVSAGSYRIVLAAKQDPIRWTRQRRVPGSATRWAGDPVGVA
jgi:hypothetical protein